jgi:hypothetical protein
VIKRFAATHNAFFSPLAGETEAIVSYPQDVAGQYTDQLKGSIAASTLAFGVVEIIWSAFALRKFQRRRDQPNLN